MKLRRVMAFTDVLPCVTFGLPPIGRLALILAEAAALARQKIQSGQP
jgi:hypothetical protein